METREQQSRYAANSEYREGGEILYPENERHASPEHQGRFFLEAGRDIWEDYPCFAAPSRAVQNSVDIGQEEYALQRDLWGPNLVHNYQQLDPVSAPASYQDLTRVDAEKHTKRRRHHENQILGAPLQPSPHLSLSVSPTEALYSMAPRHSLKRPRGNASKEEVTDSIVSVFPDICKDYLLDLFDKDESQAHNKKERIMALILDNSESGIEYPRGSNKSLKRKRTLDEDKEAFNKYSNADRAPVGQAYKGIARAALSSEFVRTPMTFIDAALIQCNDHMFPAYEVLEEAERTWNLQAPAYCKLKSARKVDPKFSADNVEESIASDNTTEDTKLALGELKASRRMRLNAFNEREKIRTDALAEAQNLRQAESDGTIHECECCFSDFPLNRMVHCNHETTLHWFCKDCARNTAEAEIGNGKYEIFCMSMDGCSAKFSRQQIYVFLGEKSILAMDRHEQETNLRLANIENLATCPYCPFAAIYPPVEVDKEFKCLDPDCERVSCRLCRLDSHIPQTCTEFAAENDESARRQVEEAMSGALIRKCNNCAAPFIKVEGCNKMTCGKCHNVQCYVCHKDAQYDHFNDPARGGRSGNCPLFDASVESRHEAEVLAAEKEALAKVRSEHPEYSNADLEVSSKWPKATPGFLPGYPRARVQAVGANLAREPPGAAANYMGRFANGIPLNALIAPLRPPPPPAAYLNHDDNVLNAMYLPGHAAFGEIDFEDLIGAVDAEVVQQDLARDRPKYIPNRVPDEMLAQLVVFINQVYTRRLHVIPEARLQSPDVVLAGQLADLRIRAARQNPFRGQAVDARNVQIDHQNVQQDCIAVLLAAGEDIRAHVLTIIVLPLLQQAVVHPPDNRGLFAYVRRQGVEMLNRARLIPRVPDEAIPRRRFAIPVQRQEARPMLAVGDGMAGLANRQAALELGVRGAMARLNAKIEHRLPRQLYRAPLQRQAPAENHGRAIVVDHPADIFDLLRERPEQPWGQGILARNREGARVNNPPVGYDGRLRRPGHENAQGQQDDEQDRHGPRAIQGGDQSMVDRNQRLNHGSRKEADPRKIVGKPDQYGVSPLAERVRRDTEIVNQQADRRIIAEPRFNINHPQPAVLPASHYVEFADRRQLGHEYWNEVNPAERQRKHYADFDRQRGELYQNQAREYGEHAGPLRALKPAKHVSMGDGGYQAKMEVVNQQLAERMGRARQAIGGDNVDRERAAQRDDDVGAEIGRRALQNRAQYIPELGRNIEEAHERVLRHNARGHPSSASNASNPQVPGNPDLPIQDHRNHLPDRFT